MCSDRIPGNSGQSGDETRRKAEQAEQLKRAGAESVQAGQLAEAIKSLLQASQLAPDSASIFLNLSAAYGADQQFDQALEAADKAIQLNPKSAVAHLNRSFALQSVGRHEDAATARGPRGRAWWSTRSHGKPRPRY